MEVFFVQRDVRGHEIFFKVLANVTDNEIVAPNNDRILSTGTYLITASSNNKFYSKERIVK